MNYRIFIIIFFLFTYCDEANDAEREADSKPYNITISGAVTDQATGLPVSEATVSVGKETYPNQTGIFNKSTLTGSDGRYEITTLARHYNSDVISPGTYMLNRIVLIASKSGYIGSNRPNLHYYGATNSNIDIQLYLSSELNLHIINDTTNNIDAVSIKVRKLPEFKLVTSLSFNERKLETTISIKDLWGNCEYYIEVLNPNGQPFSPGIQYRFTPKPALINTFDIKF